MCQRNECIHSTDWYPSQEIRCSDHIRIAWGNVYGIGTFFLTDQFSWIFWISLNGDLDSSQRPTTKWTLALASQSQSGNTDWKKELNPQWQWDSYVFDLEGSATYAAICLMNPHKSSYRTVEAAVCVEVSCSQAWLLSSDTNYPVVSNLRGVKWWVVQVSATGNLQWMRWITEGFDDSKVWNWNQIT